MRPLAKLAIKNILRNKRRSIITATAIAFGGFIMLNALGYIAGLRDAMVGMVLDTGIGHIQIHHTGYAQALEDQTVSSDLVVAEDDVNALIERAGIADDVEAVANKRTVFSGLLGNGTGTTHGLVMGVNPETETRFFGDLTISEGRYLASGDEGSVLVSERVERVFGVGAGDKITIATQAAEGGFNTSEYTVIGVFGLGSEFNFRYAVDALMNIESVASLTASDDLTEVAILLKDVDQVNAVVAALEAAAENASLDVEVQGWRSMGKRLLDIATYMEMGMRGWTMLIFIGIALSILNTLLMSVYERTPEVGILKAIGMKRKRILSLFLLETLFLSLFASALALVASALSVSILSTIGLPGLLLDFLPPGEAVHPAIQLADAAICAAVAVGISTLAGLFPARQASRMDPVAALRYE